MKTFQNEAFIGGKKNQIVTEGPYPNLTKAIFDKPVQHHIKWERTKNIFFKSGTRGGCPPSPLLVNLVLETF